MNTNTGGPAFPPQHDPETHPSGMTLRQYAAIKLRVPDSGTDWLDEMIHTSLRNDLAAKALPGILYMVTQDVELGAASSPKGCSQEAYDLADAMLKAEGKVHVQPEQPQKEPAAIFDAELRAWH